jgi:hypothetical protein
MNPVDYAKILKDYEKSKESQKAIYSSYPEVWEEQNKYKYEKELRDSYQYYGEQDDTPKKFAVSYFRNGIPKEKFFASYDDAMRKMKNFLCRGICATMKKL